jgi:epoxide hydrolase-like predicted phosphatase
MIKALIFDYGGVLALPQDKSCVEKMQEICNIPPDEFVFNYNSRRPEYDRGTINGFEYWASILESGNSETTSEVLRALINEDIKSWTRINPNILDLVKKLRQHNYRTAILSNMTEETLEYIMKNFGWISVFDVTVFSCRLGMIKPEPTIYYYCLNELKIEPENGLFIDDDIVNVEAARKIGIKTVHYKNLQQLRIELQKLGVNINT